jgi:hypothetical protein
LNSNGFPSCSSKCFLDTYIDAVFAYIVEHRLSLVNISVLLTLVFIAGWFGFKLITQALVLSDSYRTVVLNIGTSVVFSLFHTFALSNKILFGKAREISNSPVVEVRTKGTQYKETE